MAFDISLTGIRAQTARMQVTAHNIANASTPGFTFYRALLAAQHPAGVALTDIEQPHAPLPPDTPADVDMPAEMVELIAAQRAFEANIRMIEVESHAQDFLLNRLHQ